MYFKQTNKKKDAFEKSKHLFISYLISQGECVNTEKMTHYRKHVEQELQLNSTQNLAGCLCIYLRLCVRFAPPLPTHPLGSCRQPQRSLSSDSVVKAVSSQSAPDKRPTCAVMLRIGTPLGPAVWLHRQDVWLSRYTMRQPVRDNKRLCNSEGPGQLLSGSLLIICPAP